jgi:hypothetical protein
VAGVEGAAAGPRVLVLGLDPRRVPGPWDPEPVVQAIGTGMARLAERGFEATSCLLALDGSDDVDARVSAALVSQRWGCVVVGGGLRGSEEQVELFETVINLVHRLAPQAEIAFNTSPQDLAVAVERRLEPPADMA